MAKKSTDDASPGRLKQLLMVARMVRKTNPKGLLIVAAVALATLVVFVVAGLVTDSLLYTVPLGLMTAVLAGLVVFGRVAQRAQYSVLEGQPGAAAAILENLRGKWTVTPAVAGNRNLDVVHRAVGRPGVVLVSEGPSSRVGHLLAAEKKRVARVAHEVPIYDLQVGDEKNQIPVSKLQKRITKLPRNLKKGDMAELNHRLKALPQAMQMPKGPVPKNAKLPKAPKPKTR